MGKREKPDRKNEVRNMFKIIGLIWVASATLILIIVKNQKLRG